MTKQKVVLLTEDDNYIREIIGDKLRLEGFNVLEAADGADGLVTALNENPDLVVIDILMPKMNGIDMMKKIRESSPWGKNVPIILLTNLNPDTEEINKAIAENEPAYYIVKSNCPTSDLIEKIKERLNRPQ